MKPRHGAAAARGAPLGRPLVAAVGVVCLLVCASVLPMAGCVRQPPAASPPGPSAGPGQPQPGTAGPAAAPLSPPPAEESDGPFKTGQVLRDFTLPDPSGRQVSLDQILARTPRGALLSFVSTSCVPCRQDLADLSGAYSKYKSSGVEFVAVFLCESRGQVADLARQLALPMPVLCDVGFSVADSLGLEYVPVHVLVTPDRTVWVSYGGRSMDSRTGANRLFTALDWFLWKVGK